MDFYNMDISEYQVFSASFKAVIRGQQMMEFTQWFEKHLLQWKEWVCFILTLARAYSLVSEKYQY